jgi:hypothetical protein
MAKKVRKPPAKAKSGKKRMGRPPARGETVPLAMRLSKDLAVKIELLRRRAQKGLTRTKAVEKLIRAGLKREGLG